ncbi:MAG: glycosyltransferase family 4 protein, partial [Patescibacteria group bacterium]
SELMLLGAMNEEMAPFFKKYAGHYNYVGKVPQAELYKHYSQGSVFVMPSIEEGLALVQPQAMACGLPIIATTNTGAEDIVRDGLDGFIIPIRDVSALKEKILYLYEHPEERKKMSASAKEHVSSGFTWDDYGNKMIAEYERILNIKNKNA